MRDSEDPMTMKGSAVATIRRISSLGMTSEEAAGWYRNNMVNGSRGGVFTAIFALILILVTWSPADALLESSLMVRVTLQHFLYVVTGCLVAYAVHCLALDGLSVRFSLIYDAVMEVLSKVNRWGILSFVLSALLVYYWMVPTNFDAAALNEFVHSELHFTFLCVGVLIFIGSRSLPLHVRRLAPLVAGKAMGLSGTFLLLTTKHLYNAYPAWEQAETGVVLIFVMLLMDVTILPHWLYGYFGNSSNATKLNVKGMTDQSSNQNY